MDDLQNTVSEFIRAQITVLNERIRMRFQAYQSRHSTEQSKFTAWAINPPLFQANGKGFKAILSYSGLAAWIAEYGSGSQIDILNPYLKNYHIDAFRKTNHYAFTGHRAGDIVKRPDGTFYESKGNAAGRNLEEHHPYYEPQKPEHIIYKEITAWLSEVIPELQKLTQQVIIAKIKQGVKS